ncbi:hypothetical protein BSKO_05468 [Bryopsis sp. KO-2023]|nr:hypothetical protein BSKO_05468 [Bryopsis sp. KO-2023]
MLVESTCFARSVSAPALPSTRSRVRCRHSAPSRAAAKVDRGLSRRSLLSGSVALSSLLGIESVNAVELVPLGKAEHIGGEKRTGLSVEEIKDVLEKDFTERKYFITGNLTPEIFADDCRFRDPTNDTTGLSKYVKALGILFDPKNSDIVLKDMRVASATTIEAEWTLSGYLKFPWNPNIPPVEGTVVYTLNNEGLIQFQDEKWGTPAFKVLIDSLTPGSPPPN